MRTKISINDLADALRESEKERLHNIKEGAKAAPTEEAPSAKSYQLMMKRKRLTGLLSQALREGGFEDVAKRTKFRQSSEEEN